MAKFLLYKFGQFCVTHLPLAWSYRIAQFISDCQYALSLRDRRAVQENLRQIGVPEPEINTQAREVFRNFGRYLVEFFRMAREANRDYIARMVDCQGLSLLDETLAKGRGAILLTAHVGNWELGGVVLSQLGYRTVAVALPHKERPVNTLFNRQRESRGVMVIPVTHAFRRCVRTLREGGIVALVADRVFTSQGEVMPFLGKKALLPKGPAILSALTGAPILPVFLFRKPEGRFCLEFEQPIEPPQTFSDTVPDEVIQDLMRRTTRIIENKIREYPSQWLMFRRFWIEEEK